MVEKKRTTRKAVTLGDVARAAKVSPMTVSNFINGRLKHMTATTRERVERAVRDLNYRPHTAARGLRQSRRLSIGIIVVDESPLYLSDGFTNEVVSGLTNSLNDHDLTLQLEGRTAKQFVQSSLIRDVRTDGLCLMLSGSDPVRRSLLETAMRLNQPVVLLIERPSPSFLTAHPNLCSVIQDDRTGAAMLTRHLLDRGARHCLFLRHDLSRWWAVDERERGIRSVIEKAGRGATLKVAGCGNGSIAEAQAALAAAIERDGLPDAVMGANDKIGIAALKFLVKNKVPVPDRVRITGFNAFDSWEYSSLPLTTVRSRGYEIGKSAGEEMIGCLQRGSFSNRSIKLPIDLVVGETT